MEGTSQRDTVNMQLNKLIIEDKKVKESGLRAVEQWLSEPEEDRGTIVWFWNIYQEPIVSQHWLFHQICVSTSFINTFHLPYCDHSGIAIYMEKLFMEKAFPISSALSHKNMSFIPWQRAVLTVSKSLAACVQIKMLAWLHPLIGRPLPPKKTKKKNRHVITHLKLRLSHIFRVSQPPHRDLLLFRDLLVPS